MRARGLYINTHAGEAIREGGLAWAVEKYDPDLIVLVEVGRALDRARLVRMFNKDKWSITGLKPVHGLLVESGTFIIAKRSVLLRRDWKNPIITKQRWVGLRRDKWHPIRRLTRANFIFADNHDVELEVGADHAWTYAGYELHGDHEVPTNHRRQIRRFAQAAGQADERDVAVLDIGDFNEHFGGRKTYAESQMGRSGLHALVLHRLDAIFANGKVGLIDFDVIPEDKIKTDHDGLVFDVRVWE